MQITRSGLITQFRRDAEFRTSLISHIIATILSFATSFFPYNIQFTSFVCICTALFIACYLYKYVFIYPIQAVFLGWIFGSSIALSLFYCDSLILLFFRYIIILSIFHFTEFVFTAITNRRSLRPDSFLLNHSKEYWIAAVLSWIEFALEVCLFPSIKSNWISYFGLLLCFIGEFIRKTAMVHAGLGFTHRLALSKRPDHRLVTNGIYSYVRHPGYLGWFLWSVGTQFILCNPFCLIFYTIVSWKFMDNRIYDEEKDLVAFFGEQYTHYQEVTTNTGIPFSRGYSLQ